MDRRLIDWGGVLLGLVVVIAINGLANWLPIGGQGTGEVSAKYPSLFTPAGFTFAIWGLIYTGLTIYAIYQALPSQRNVAALSHIGKWFIASCIINSVWIIVWHYEYILLSLILMVGLLICLIRIYNIIHRTDQPLSLAIRLPFSVYIGWITVASIANLSALQTAMDANELGLSFVNWTLLKLAIAGAIGTIVLFLRQDPAFILVICWAAYGISSKQIGTPEVSGAAFTLTLLALLLALFQLIKNQIIKSRPQS